MSDDPDRQLIRVEFPQRQQGIAAALRRAFGSVSSRDEMDRTFDELLARLD
ncbi:hypothetical protein ABDK56_05265 [Sphingomonas sp. ASV193]|uniref:hypothetical protein n=1 Tax=Sphingomonas sp. ASV193 TaxID=3144405 RepID=UPI0032E8B2B3